MAPKIEPPPASSSSSSSSSSSEQEISDKEEYQPQDPKTEPKSLAEEQEFMEEEEEEEAPNTTQFIKFNFESDSGSGFNSESDSAIIPIGSNSMEELTQPNNPTRKHPSETQQNEDESQRKKSKISNGDEEGEKDKSAIYKIWSDDDEITLLKGMIDYRLKNRVDSSSYMGAILEFIKNSLHIDVSKNQLRNKIWRLQRKYRNNVKKSKNGEDPVFPKLHEQRSFELSKKIWGVDNVKSPKREEIDTNYTVVLEREDPQELKAKKDDFGTICSRNEGSCLLMSMSVEEFVKERMSLIGSEKAKELEEKWKSLKVDEIELFLKRVELIKEQTKLVLAAMKSSNS